jgi:hypothetical protein
VMSRPAGQASCCQVPLLPTQLAPPHPRQSVVVAARFS